MLSSATCSSNCATGSWMAGRRHRCSMTCITCCAFVVTCCGPTRALAEACRRMRPNAWSRRSGRPDRPCDASIAFTARVPGRAEFVAALVPQQRLHVTIVTADRLESMPQSFQGGLLPSGEGIVLDLDMIGQVLMVEAWPADPLTDRLALHRL